MNGNMFLSNSFSVNVDLLDRILTMFSSKVVIIISLASHFLIISRKYFPGKTTVPFELIFINSELSKVILIEISWFEVVNITASSLASIFIPVKIGIWGLLDIARLELFKLFNK